MKVKELVNIVDFESTDNVKFFHYDTDEYCGVISLESLIEDELVEHIRDIDVVRFTWFENDLWIYI